MPCNPDVQPMPVCDQVGAGGSQLGVFSCPKHVTGTVLKDFLTYRKSSWIKAKRIIGGLTGRADCCTVGTVKEV
jgi:hypothetical protein